MKYKVGDKVRVRSDLKDNRRYGACIYVEAGYRGMIATIKEVKNGYYWIKEDGNGWRWTDEMLEPIDEMSAEEAVRLIGVICRNSKCSTCPMKEISTARPCNEVRMENPEKVVKVLKQWKEDHEKKPIETEFQLVVRVIEDTRTMKRCVYEEKLPEGIALEKAQSEILKKYCSEHEGNFFATVVKNCVVKGK
jgi:hypothetical protein